MGTSTRWKKHSFDLISNFDQFHVIFQTKTLNECYNVFFLQEICKFICYILTKSNKPVPLCKSQIDFSMSWMSFCRMNFSICQFFLILVSFIAKRKKKRVKRHDFLRPLPKMAHWAKLLDFFIIIRMMKIKDSKISFHGKLTKCVHFEPSKLESTDRVFY